MHPGSTKQGNPDRWVGVAFLPWYSYPMIAFLSDRVRPQMRVFEYGSGYSTLWWSERVAQVTSCKHDQDWYDLLRARAPANVDLR